MRLLRSRSLCPSCPRRPGHLYMIRHRLLHVALQGSIMAYMLDYVCITSDIWSSVPPNLQTTVQNMRCCAAASRHLTPMTMPLNTTPRSSGCLNNMLAYVPTNTLCSALRPRNLTCPAQNQTQRQDLEPRPNRNIRHKQSGGSWVELGLYWGYIGIMENKMETTIQG